MLHAFVQVQGGIDPDHRSAFAAGLVDGPHAFRRAVCHAISQGYTLVRARRVRSLHQRKTYGLATLVRPDDAGAVHCRTITIELHTSARAEALGIAHLYQGIAAPIARFLA